MLGVIKPVWAYRGFVLSSVKREFQLKYRNSMLGATWTILQPLSMILVYTVIFSQIMRARLPGVDSSFGYSIYLCAGILSWGLFSEITTRSQNMFIEHSNLIKKISFPRLCLPIVIILTALVNFSIIFSLFLLFLFVTAGYPSVAFLSLVPLLGLLIVFSASLGMVLGVLNVFFRDVGQLYSIVITFWFWLTPIVYPLSILPKKMQLMLQLNPMVSVVTAIQGVLVQGLWPRWASLMYPAVITIILCLLGIKLFRTHSGDMVDEL